MIYGEFTSPELGQLAQEKIALLPTAATEQHGNHLPVITDTALVSEVARRVEKQLQDQILLLPTFWVGSSHHHTGFPGTMSISSETYVCVLVDLVESLIRTGFRRILLLNGHGGNTVPLQEALYRLNQRHRDDACEPWVAASAYWTLASKELKSAGFMETPKLTHACEYETSMMLALRENWVKMEKAEGHRCDQGSEFYDPLSYEPSRVNVVQSFHQLTPTGAMGRPELASAEKGEKLFELVSGAVVRFLQEFEGWKERRHG